MYNPVAQKGTVGSQTTTYHGTGQYGATLKGGPVRKPERQAVVRVNKTDVEIQGNVDSSLVAHKAMNTGATEFADVECEGDSASEVGSVESGESVEGPTVIDSNGADRGPVVRKEVVSSSAVICDFQTHGLKFSKRKTRTG